MRRVHMRPSSKAATSPPGRQPAPPARSGRSARWLTCPSWSVRSRSWQRASGRSQAERPRHERDPAVSSRGIPGRVARVLRGSVGRGFPPRRTPSRMVGSCGSDPATPHRIANGGIVRFGSRHAAPHPEWSPVHLSSGHEADSARRCSVDGGFAARQAHQS